jgi:hypothetical protein
MNRLLLVLTLASALGMTACSNGGGTTVLPPPQGKYSLGSLSGTYSFVTNGEVFTNGAFTATPLARTGSFVADGKGGISGGVEDVNAAGAFSGPFAISGGSYTVAADGRGTLTLNVSSNGSANTLQFGITLTSTSGGLMIDETSFSTSNTQASTGSGNFIIQNTALCSNPVSAAAGSYVFDFAGLDGNGSAMSLVGEITANGGVSGVLNPGFADLNDGGTLSNGSINGQLGIDGVNPAGPTVCGRGLATISGQNYIFYVVDATRVRFLSSSGNVMISGDAVLQNNLPANLSGGFAFIVAGSDNATQFGPLTRLGRFTVSGATVTNVLVDTNDAGAFTPTDSGVNTNVTLDAANPGRGTVTFKDPNLSTPFTFVFYLSSATRGVIQETTSKAGVALAIADGTLAAQTGGPFSGTNIAGTYGINWSGLSIQNGGGFAVADEEDLVGQATISSLSLKGAADIFQFQKGAPQVDNAVSGAITISGDGTGGDGKTVRNTMTVTLTKGSPANVDFVVYFASPQVAFIASNGQTNRIVAGILQAQQ